LFSREEVYLYKYHGHIFTFQEFFTEYNYQLLNHPSQSTIKPINQLLEIGEIKKLNINV
jgi:hypothetical protein